MSEAAATTPGSRLRTAREAKGLSAQTAADELHLDAWVIEALEQGDYARIGPGVYAKGHLKHYAAMLGLPVAEVLEAYEPHATPAPAEAARAAVPNATAAFNGLGGSPPHREAWWARGAVGLAILVAVAALARWQPWHDLEDSWRAARAAKTARVESDRATGPRGDRATDGPVRPVSASPASPLPAELAAAGPVPGTGPARLRLRFSADSWVDVHDAAGRRLFAGNGRANSVKTIAGDAPMKVYLGSASGVQLEVNSHAVAIGPQFMAGDVARFEAGADGILRRDSRTALVAHPRG